MVEHKDSFVSVWLPNDWELMPLGECVTEKLSYGINAPAVPFDGKSPAYIRITDITEDGRFDGSDRKAVHTQEKDRYLLRDGDIVLARTGASTGKSYLYNKKDGDLVYAGFLIKASIDASRHNPRFIVGQLRTPRYWSWVAAMSMRSGQPGINGKEYSSFLVPVAPKKEQDAIADTLQVFDTHISNLTELIEKKKAIRDGALEDLVSGRTRLAGFASKWSTIPFDKYFSLLKNNTYAREMLSEHGTIGNIHYGDVLIKYGNIVSESDEIPRLKEGVTYSEKWLLQKNDVLIADTAEDETVGKAIQIGTISFPLVGGLHTIVCRPNFETASGFLGYYINSKAFHDQLLPHITGIKVSSISKKAIKTTEVCIPSDVEEQKAIADVLAAMDDEIKALEDERDKMIQIREGAMDDLLTGRVRLSMKEAE